VSVADYSKLQSCDIGVCLCVPGEEDQDAYDINRLKKPVENGTMKKPPIEDPINKTKDRPQYRCECLVVVMLPPLKVWGMWL